MLFLINRNFLDSENHELILNKTDSELMELSDLYVCLVNKSIVVNEYKMFEDWYKHYYIEESMVGFEDEVRYDYKVHGNQDDIELSYFNGELSFQGILGVNYYTEGTVNCDDYFFIHKKPNSELKQVENEIKLNCYEFGHWMKTLFITLFSHQRLF